MEPKGPYWGKDKRFLPGITAWLQNLFTFASNTPPVVVTLEFLGLRVYFPFRGKYWCFRTHIFRYDYYAKAYIFFSGMFKAVGPLDVAP